MSKAEIKLQKQRVKMFNNHFKKNIGKENAEIDALIQEDINKALERAKLLLDLNHDEVSAPIVIKAANIDNERVKYRVTKVGEKARRVEFTESLLTTIYLGKRSLFLHEVIVNHIHGREMADVASEVRYRDIVHVETFVDYDHRVDHIGLSSLYLLLHLVDGSTLSFNLRSHYLHNQKDYAELLSNDERKVISTIQAAVRSAK